VYDAVYDSFCSGVADIVKQMRQGAPLHSPFVDCGALCMPAHHLHLQRLVDDALAKGARLLAGGAPPPSDSPLASGQFYPPTILADVTEGMAIMQEEIFGAPAARAAAPARIPDPPRAPQARSCASAACPTARRATTRRCASPTTATSRSARAHTLGAAGAPRPSARGWRRGCPRSTTSRARRT